MTMITREDVIRNANRYLNIQAWTPKKDTITIKYKNHQIVFKSAFISVKEDCEMNACVPQEYNVTPYVFGGSIGPTELLNALQSGDRCPGGWDMKTGRGTKDFEDIREMLVGIDCSEYVMRSWGFPSKQINNVWYGTGNLPNLCLKIGKDMLKKGDILLKPGHVRIFHCWADPGKNNAWIYEAAGVREVLKRSFRSGDDQGCVGRWMRPWEDIYTPYSPFPQFIDFTPRSGFFLPMVDNDNVRISVTCIGRGNIDVNMMILDWAEVTFAEACVSVRWSTNSGIANIGGTRATCIRPIRYLSRGRHRVEVIATNTVQGASFRDSFSWEFDVV